MSELRQGTQLAARYTLRRELGHGGEAVLWLADDSIAKTPVTLKIVSHADAVARLRSEWQTNIRLMHAHIVRAFELHDTADDGDTALAWYARQFIDGPEFSVLSGAPASHILAPCGLIADALRYAHNKGVVHRDIKAANILLDQNGAPYLIDFGVAGTAGGSLIASSPQQLRGEAPQPADDVFALGGLMYELLSGRSPYSAANTEDDILHRSPPPLQMADGSTVPPRLQALLTRMLDKDALARPDAETVADELKAAGFAAGTAPPEYTQYTGSRSLERDEVIQAVPAATAPQRTAQKSAARRALTPGLRPVTVVSALLLLLGALLAVVFLLPAVVDRDTPLQGTTPTAERAPVAAGGDDDEAEVAFNENRNEVTSRDARLRARDEAEQVLGKLLSHVDTLEKRAVQRWGGTRFEQATQAYESGDAAYLQKDYATATHNYREAIAVIEPLLDEVEDTFASTLADAQAAFADGNTEEAVRLYDLAVAITPNHADALAGYKRAKNLATVLSLVAQGDEYEQQLELAVALESFEKAMQLDPEWQPATDGVQRVQQSIVQMEFDQRMTEGLLALEQGDYYGARAAFTMARSLKPASSEPADGLLQVEQGLKLGGIATLENQAYAYAQGEQWQSAVETYEEILKLDSNLSFAQEGLAEAREMQALHEKLAAYIDDPDVLSRPATMKSATTLLVDLARMPDAGPRLQKQRDHLSRLLKRAATPLKVQLVSDNETSVSIYKVGRLGSFATQELSLRPGTYVAVGSRPGFRDVRLEFRVAPEIDMQPVIVRCEEAI